MGLNSRISNYNFKSLTYFFQNCKAEIWFHCDTITNSNALYNPLQKILFTYCNFEDCLFFKVTFKIPTLNERRLHRFFASGKLILNLFQMSHKYIRVLFNFHKKCKELMVLPTSCCLVEGWIMDIMTNCISTHQHLCEKKIEFKSDFLSPHLHFNERKSRHIISLKNPWVVNKKQ